MEHVANEDLIGELLDRGCFASESVADARNILETEYGLYIFDDDPHEDIDRAIQAEESGLKQEILGPIYGAMKNDNVDELKAVLSDLIYEHLGKIA